MLQHHAQQHALAFAHLDQVLGARQVDFQRLLHQHMFAGMRQPPDQREVAAGWCQHQHGPHAGIFQNVFQPGGPVGALGQLRRSQPGGISGMDPDQFGFMGQVVQTSEVRAGTQPGANHGQSQAA